MTNARCVTQNTYSRYFKHIGISQSMAYNVFREQRAEKEKKGFVSIYIYEKIFILQYSFFE